MGDFRLHFQKSGLHTTVQDLGRLGYQHLGVPINGTMDKTSASLANDLVGNKRNCPLFEITLIGPKIIFEGTGQIAITGADLSASINGVEAELFKTLNIKNGDVLEFGKPKQGCRTYIAVGGKWRVWEWLGSYSASATNPKTLTPQSLIKKGATFNFEGGRRKKIQSTPLADRPVLAAPLKVRILPGPEFDSFSKETIDYFFKYWFPISQDANRMGYRLEKILPGFNPEREVISSGIVPGTIQITNAGQPIILMADAQTSGGYFRLANIISEDLDKAAQLKPGDLIGFELVNIL